MSNLSYGITGDAAAVEFDEKRTWAGSAMAPT
jgi:hypothetical protein